MSNLEDHLLSRRLYYKNYKCYLDNDNEIATFYLFNLSGKLVGYQSYNYKMPKTRNNSTPFEQKYFTYVIGKKEESEIAFWGFERYDFQKQYLFLTEGIFDACVLHNFGLNALAVLANNPKKIKNWIRTVNHTTIALCDGDSAGLKLASYCDMSIIMPVGKDANNLSNSELEFLLKDYILN